MDTKIDIKPKKILWAVDAFPESPAVQAEVGRMLCAFSRGVQAAIEPVYVTRLEPFVTSGTEISVEEKTSHELVARKSIEKLMSSLVAVPCLAPPHIIGSDAYSTLSAVRALVSYAKEKNFDFIAVGTHARKGVPRFFLGSFAETLVHESQVPVLVTNPKLRYSHEIRHIVFPTDFSDASYSGFKAAVAIAKEKQTDILLFHHAPMVHPELIYPFIFPPVTMPSKAEIKAELRAKSQSWVAWAFGEGVKVKFCVSFSSKSTAERIAQMARRLNGSVLAMVPRTSRASATLLGSTTRKVLRIAPCPILVLRQSEKKMPHSISAPADHTAKRAILS